MYMPVDDIKQEMRSGQSHLPFRDQHGRLENPLTLPTYQFQTAAPSVRQKTPHTPSPPPPPPPNPDPVDGLQFINLLGTEKHDTQGRNTVRSHARRHAWKNQKQQQDRKEVLASNDHPQSKIKPRKSSREKTNSFPPSPNHGDQFFDQCSRFREVAAMLPSRSRSNTSNRAATPSQGVFSNLPPELARCAESAIALISSPNLSTIEVRNGHSDPFDVFPIPLTPRLHHLIHYSRGIRNLVNEDPQDTFAYHMGNTPALVYSTLAWTTAMSSCTQAGRNLESEYFLQKSITAINEELSRLNGHGISDGIIAAVACLTNMENLNGDSTKARIHMNGLQQMISMRGGMNTLGMNGVLRRLVLWADVFSATRWKSTPQFPLVELPDLLDLAPLCYFRPTTTPKPHFAITNPTFLTAASTIQTADLPSIMKEIYELAHFLDNVPNKDPNLLDRASFPDRIYIVEHKILWLISQAEVTQPRDSIILPLLHSLLLYIYTNIRLTPVDGQIRKTLITRLKTYLEAADLPALNIHFPHELRWSLFLGGGAAVAGTCERQFFVKTLVEAGCRREWGSWENVVFGLKGMETAFLERCEGFWREVDEVRESVDCHRGGKHGVDCVGYEEYFLKMEVELKEK